MATDECMSIEYKGFFIVSDTGSFDVLDSDGDLIDGYFKSIVKAKQYIDMYIKC